MEVLLPIPQKDKNSLYRIENINSDVIYDENIDANKIIIIQEKTEMQLKVTRTEAEDHLIFSV